MYAWLLAIAMRVIHPSLWWQFPVVHLVNFVVFVASLLCFRYLVRSMLSASGVKGRLPDRFLWPIGYGLFLWCSLDLIGVQTASPDLLLSAWIFLLAGLLARLRADDSLRKFALFGLILGAAYLTKSFMFPLGFVFLLIGLISGTVTRRRVAGILLATAVFLGVSFPLIVLLSRAKGRLTFSDTGKLAYAWFVSPKAPMLNLQSSPEARLSHPTRKILEHPPVYEFSQPVSGTYPPWSDPSYWNEGIQPRFRLSAQKDALVDSLKIVSRLLAGQLGWLAGLAILGAFAWQATFRGILNHWPLLLASLVAVGAYSLVLVMPRYVAPFLAIFCSTLLASVRLPGGKQAGRAARFVAILTTVAIMISAAQPLVSKTYQKWSGGVTRSREEPIRAAEKLLQMGLHPNDRVATLGDGISDYWARLAGFKIVAQIIPGDDGGKEFWSLAPEREETVYHSLAQTGALALVTWDASRSELGPGWQKIPGTGYHVYFLTK